jgi:PAS domain S-box-containing protein
MVLLLEKIDKRSANMPESQAPEQPISAHRELPRADFRAMILNSSDAVFVVAMDGRVTFANPATERLFGYTPDEFLADPRIVEKMIHPDYREQFHRFWKERLSGRGVSGAPIEWGWLRKDGTLIYTENTLSDILDCDGRLIGFQSVGRDITRRKQSEERAAQLQQKLQSIVSAVAEGIFGVDLDGRCTFVNPAAAEILGWKPEELLGRMQHEILHHTRPGSSPYSIAECPIALSYQSNEVHDVADEVLWRKDGTSFPVEYTSSPLRDQDGKMRGAVVVFRDISNRQALERLREEWTSLIAHDLRQPLSALQMRLQILQALPQTSDTIVQQQLAHMQTSLTHFNRMVNDLLDASQLESDRIKLELIEENLKVSVNEIIERMRPLFPSHPIVLEGSDDAEFVCIDPMRFEQIVGNILGNAVKYGRAGSPIRINLGRRGPSAHIAISNEGDPIPADKLPALFDRFTRAGNMPGTANGLGLGLYITRGLVEAQGGRIDVESGGTTTTFHIHLPLQPKPGGCCNAFDT